MTEVSDASGREGRDRNARKPTYGRPLLRAARRANVKLPKAFSRSPEASSGDPRASPGVTSFRMTTAPRNSPTALPPAYFHAPP